MRIRKIARKLIRISQQFLARFSPASPMLTADKSEWQSRAQEGEFEFHLTDRWRASVDFMGQTIRLLTYFGFSAEDFQGKTIIDLGAGSKLRTKFFRGAKIVVIEPLAQRFIDEIPWCDLTDAEMVYTSPAEERIDACVNSADLLISINVLDHCYDFLGIIGNIGAYLKDEGLAFISFDEHHYTDDMHPLILTEDICTELFQRNGLMIQRSSKGAGDVLTTYGHGDYCLNWWLRKAARMRDLRSHSLAN